MYPVWLLAAGFLLFGLLFGSFLNVCIYRLPLGRSVVSPGSACPHCGRAIAAWDNIPVLSWLILGGRCRHCRAGITPRYALVELGCGLLFLYSFLHAHSYEEAAKSCVLCFLLLGLTFTDAETHILPDAMTLNGLGIGLVLSFFVMVPGPLYSWWPILPGSAHSLRALGLMIGERSLANALLGAAAGAGTLWLIGELYRRVRHVDGMGLGDVKLMAMVGAFLGPVLTFFVMATASMLGALFGGLVLVAVYRKRRMRYSPRLGAAAGARSWQAAQVALRGMELPFGVFLCLMSLTAWFYGQAIIRWYFGLFSISY